MPRYIDIQLIQAAISRSIVYTIILIIVFDDVSSTQNLEHDGRYSPDEEMIRRYKQNLQHDVRYSPDEEMIRKYKMMGDMRKNVKLIKVDCGKICDTIAPSHCDQTFSKGMLFAP